MTDTAAPPTPGPTGPWIERERTLRADNRRLIATLIRAQIRTADLAGLIDRALTGTSAGPPPEERAALAQALDSADRFGADVDVPEGSRYVQISDTQVRLLARMLRDL